MRRTTLSWNLISIAALGVAPASALATPRQAGEPGGPKDLARPSEASHDPKESLRAAVTEVSQRRFLHGFRLGYVYVANIAGPVDSQRPSGPSLKEKYDIRSPHQFLLGYEGMLRMIGHDWLNVLLIANVSASGFEQSRFFPGASGLIGFELAEALQLGVGVHATPVQDKPLHMLVAAGWTPRVGDFYTPVHVVFVPDVDGQHRMALTVGVNW